MGKLFRTGMSGKRRWCFVRRCVLILMLPVFFASCLVTNIAISAETVIYPIKKEYSLFNLTADALLQIIAGLNKFLDVLAAGSFAALANTVNDIRLRHPDFNGIHLQDFDITEALCSPIQSVKGAVRLWRSRKRVKTPTKAVLKFLFVFATSVCIWLLPVANNTLLIPKLIYHPLLHSDGWPSSIPTDVYTPRVIINDVRWNYTGAEPTLDLSDKDSEDILSNGRLASLIYSALFDFSEDYVEGFNAAKRLPEKYMTAYMHMDSHTVRGASLRAVDIERLFDATKVYGPSYAKLSARIWGDINITTPSVQVQCAGSSANLTAAQSFTISEINSDQSFAKTFAVHVGAVEHLNSSAITCTISLEQYLFPIGSWTLQDDAHTWPGVVIWLNPNTTSVYPSPHPADNLLLQRLFSILQTTLPELDVLSTLTYQNDYATISHSSTRHGSAYLRFLVDRARSLRAQQQHDGTVFRGNDIPYIARLLAFWAQHTLTLAHWDLSTSETEMTYSRRINYMVYASGPRLRWQFTILIVPCWLLVVTLAGLGFCFWFASDIPRSQRMDVDMWTLGGMLMAANASPKVQVAEDANRERVDKERPSMGAKKSAANDHERTRFYLRHDRSGRCVLTDKRAKQISANDPERTAFSLHRDGSDQRELTDKHRGRSHTI